MATSRDNTFRTILVLGTLAFVAFFLARGATALVGAKLTQAQTDDATSVRRIRTTPVSVRPRHDPALILQRNIFDSERGDLTDEPVSETTTLGDDGELVDVDEEQVDKCTLSLRLTGTAVIPGDFGRSLAMIVGSDSKTALYPGGAEVEGSTIRAIHADSVYLMSGSGDLCRIAMFEVDDTAPPPVAKAPEPRRRQKRPSTTRPTPDRNAGLSDAEIAEGIDKVTDTSFTIQRTMLNKVLDNAGKLIGIAAVSPKIVDGQSVGMEIRGIRPDTLLTKLGIQNNDVLEAVNGQPLTSPDAALGAYTTLRTADKFTLAIQRGGKSMMIDYGVN